MAAVDRTRQGLLASLERHESFFRLENDPDLLGPLIAHFLQELAGMEIGDATTRLRIGIALQESLANALFHGNLEVSSDLRQDDESSFSTWWSVGGPWTRISRGELMFAHPRPVRRVVHNPRRGARLRRCRASIARSARRTSRGLAGEACF